MTFSTLTLRQPSRTKVSFVVPPRNRGADDHGRRLVYGRCSHAAGLRLTIPTVRRGWRPQNVRVDGDDPAGSPRDAVPNDL